jgi:hypothetical protein
LVLIGPLLRIYVSSSPNILKSKLILGLKCVTSFDTYS